LPVEQISGRHRLGEESFRRAVESQQSDRVSGGRRSMLKPMVEGQAVGTNRITEVISVEPDGRQIDQFLVMGCGQDDVGLCGVVGAQQLQQHGLARGDAFDRVGAAKQFVEQEQVFIAAGTLPEAAGNLGSFG
jgi:hypothetical protein